MPAGFAYPGTTTRIWRPLRIDPASPGNRKSHSLRAIGRLRDGVSLEQARADLSTIMASWKARYPDVHTGHYLFIRPLLEDTVGAIRPALTALFAATGFVVLIVCANLASVLMSRPAGLVTARVAPPEKDYAERGSVRSSRFALSEHVSGRHAAATHHVCALTST